MIALHTCFISSEFTFSINSNEILMNDPMPGDKDIKRRLGVFRMLAKADNRVSDS
jgi:hypothetical protein